MGADRELEAELAPGAASAPAASGCRSRRCCTVRRLAGRPHSSARLDPLTGGPEPAPGGRDRGPEGGGPSRSDGPPSAGHSGSARTRTPEPDPGLINCSRTICSRIIALRAASDPRTILLGLGADGVDLDDDEISYIISELGTCTGDGPPAYRRCDQRYAATATAAAGRRLAAWIRRKLGRPEHGSPADWCEDPGSQRITGAAMRRTDDGKVRALPRDRRTGTAVSADVHDDMRAAAALLATTACGDRRLQAAVLGADLDADRLAGIARVLAFWLAYVLRWTGTSPRRIAREVITESIRIEAEERAA